MHTQVSSSAKLCMYKALRGIQRPHHINERSTVENKCAIIGSCHCFFTFVTSAENKGKLTVFVHLTIQTQT